MRKVMAQAAPDARMKVFANLAVEAAGYVERGLPRITAVDALHDMAEAQGLTQDEDQVQSVISRAFANIQYVPDIDEPQQVNGKDQQRENLLPLTDIRAWHGVPAPERRWAVQDRIPDCNVTLFTGHGGVGKTLLMQQLSVATVLGRDWIGLMPAIGSVLFITAEDDESELHYRYDLIAKQYATNFNELADSGLNVMSLAGKDATMAVADARGIVRTTQLFDTLENTVKKLRPRWIGLDTVADCFLVNERDRGQVRQCVAHMRGLCLKYDLAVILLAHPSLTGLSTGSGLSGSTAWHNSVRSRLFLKLERDKAKDDEDQVEVEEEATPRRARVLEFMKSNYSAEAPPVRLFWRNGLFMPEKTLAMLPPLDRAALEQKARDLFMELLTRRNRQDLPVSFKPNANNYAPAEFCNDPSVRELHNSREQRKKLLAGAMHALLQQERIYVGSGPMSDRPSRRKPCLFSSGSLL